MTGPEHFTESEKCLTEAQDFDIGSVEETACLTHASIHASLANTAMHAEANGLKGYGKETI
jgi:hypothetical protein